MFCSNNTLTMFYIQVNGLVLRGLLLLLLPHTDSDCLDCLVAMINAAQTDVPTWKALTLDAEGSTGIHQVGKVTGKTSLK